MTIKTTGLELKSFYLDPALWNSCDGQPLYWADGIGLVINGGDILENADINALADSDQIGILSGFVYAYEHLGEVATLEDYFRRWRNSLSALYADSLERGAWHEPALTEGLQGSLLGG